MRVVAVINRGAGTVLRQQGVDPAELRRMFAEAGVEAEIELVAGEEITAAARAAVSGGAEAVLAGGGDGTIRAVAGALAGGTVPLGVLPLGTRNHFARDLGIPIDLPGAVGVVASGQVRRLDLGEVNGEVFVNNSILGFYPPLVRVRDWQRRNLSRGKGLATAIALLRVLPRLPALRVRVKADGHEAVHETRFVFVGNNEYQMSLFSYGARQRFDSGSLYLYVARPRGRLGLVGLALLGLVRDVIRTPHFDQWMLPEFTIETRQRALPVYLDGEVTLMRPPLHYRTRERALSVILP
ncbi:MAG TPA: diacylglycerol kinase family protein [Thermoanaerobaculia bacterium]|nr:diacylglycerol kinase family protein [Thermoanaerobaculia bacterium]